MKSPLSDPILLSEIFPQCAHLSYWLRNKIQILKGLFFEVWKGEFQLIQILGLLGMYFDAVVVFVMKFTTLLRLSWATVWPGRNLENASHNNLSSKQSNKQTVVFQFWILPTKNQLMVFDCKSCDQIMTLTKWVFQVLWLALLQSRRKKFGLKDFSTHPPKSWGSEKRRKNKKTITICPLSPWVWNPSIRRLYFKSHQSSN